MRSVVFLATAASLLSRASARITGFSVPRVVAPDSAVKLLITAEDYIQSTQDVAFSFGLSPANATYAGALGTLLGSKGLGRDFSNSVGEITHYVHVPATTEKGEYSFNGAHFSLIGAVWSPSVESYVATVTVGDVTSADYVESSLVPASS